MNVFDGLNAKIAKIGPNLPEVMGILQRSQSKWLIRLADFDVGLEFDASTRRLMVFVELSTVDGIAGPETFTRLLQFNFLWRETGCVFVALNEELRPVLMVPVVLEEATPEPLTSIVAHMGEKARAFTALIGELNRASPTASHRDELKI